ncbi:MULTISPECIES: HAD hydrolase family protein [Psychromonas]|uniref:HAD hydrolase family protein n=1 Tax=Psychromonas TaxID=67572 RepID=UPI0003FED934|nr:MULTISPECIES: HAD hydrolase family protein [Psychromonas]MBB1273214.1 HAD hydrolase family protein [Psychromonas sp. SR45-3]
MSPMEVLTKNNDRLFVFTDLDDTLFASVKGQVSEHMIPSTVGVNGQPYAYSSVQQQKLLNVMIKSDAIIIPVTGRRSSSFLNCKLPAITNTDYAIVSHGAVILDNKHQLLDEWKVFLEQQFSLQLWHNKLVELYEKLSHYFEVINSGVRVRLIIDHGISTYLCLKINKDYADAKKMVQVNDYLESTLPKEMFLHANGRNFAILPPYARKKVAVDFLKKMMNVGELDTVFAMGDSHSDLPFMQDSDFLIVPQQAQIFKQE